VGEQTEILNLGEGALEHLTPGPDGCSFDPWTDPVGDLSFSANTLVLLASGKSIPIGQVKVGDKVLATNTKTGRTQAEAVMAVMVHHDSDLLDLKITDRGKTAVIRTTSNHPFWVPAVNGRPGQWVTAGDLKPGTRLRTPSGSDTATVVLGWIPKQRDGWMWDLTIPGNNDHDFYVVALTTSILVHNVGEGCVDGPAQTAHGQERAADPSRLSPSQQSDVMENATETYTQPNGAQVYVQEVNGKYNVVVQGDNGVVTNLKTISSKSLTRLARNYGWVKN
jgi:hypothetical protein